MTKYNFVPKRNRKYGWVPDIPDPRDRVYSAPPKVLLPESVSLRSLCSAVEDQGSLSSCVGNACAGMLEVLENKNGTTFTKEFTKWEKFLRSCGIISSEDAGTFTLGFMDVSRLFIYYNARVRDGLDGSDNGCSIRSALKELNAKGYCWEKDWPYDWSKVNVRPDSLCFVKAKEKKIIDYRSMYSNTEMMTCLAEGYPFVIGLSIFEGFEGKKARQTGEIDMPTLKEGARGGHAVLCIGYEKKTERYLMKNSWGEGWGDDGYFTIPFDYVANYGMDAWTIRK